MNTNDFEEADNQHEFYYTGDYDFNYNPTMNGHALDINGYPATRGTFPIHSYGHSQSMHHEHIGKNIQKIQSAAVDSTYIP